MKGFGFERPNFGVPATEKPEKVERGSFDYGEEVPEIGKMPETRVSRKTEIQKEFDKMVEALQFGESDTCEVLVSEKEGVISEVAVSADGLKMDFAINKIGEPENIFICQVLTEGQIDEPVDLVQLENELRTKADDDILSENKLLTFLMFKSFKEKVETSQQKLAA